MGMQQIIERILSDANAEAEMIVAEAEKQAAKIVSDAESRSAKVREETETEVAQKRKGILEKRAADARLDGAKLLLGEKRKVLDTVYDEAHSQLLELNQEDTLAMIARLLDAYAEQGDEIYFAERFPYADAVKILPVIAEKGLKISNERVKIEGGIYLKGEKADKDLSYPALLAADRDENQAALARELFK
jgi:V/A-type H+-transporting ATPase subunit E